MKEAVRAHELALIIFWHLATLQNGAPLFGPDNSALVCVLIYGGVAQRQSASRKQLSSSDTLAVRVGGGDSDGVATQRTDLGLVLLVPWWPS